MPPKVQHAIKVGLICLGLAILYGLINAQIAIRVSRLFFVDFLPYLGPLPEPTTLAVAWGFISTWWVGVLLGAPLGFASAFGSPPNLPIRSVVRALAYVFGGMVLTSLLAAGIGYLLPGFASMVATHAPEWPLEEQRRFTAVLFANNVGYGVAIIGGLILIPWAWWSRRQQ